MATVNQSQLSTGTKHLIQSESIMVDKILQEIIMPGFYETDAIGHINNTVIPMWFEKGRMPLFKYFTPDLDPGKWNLILVRIEVDYIAQIGYEDQVTIKTGVQRIGTSSFVVRQEAIQKQALCARGQTTMVHFDYEQNKSMPLPTGIRQVLEQHYWNDD